MRYLDALIQSYTDHLRKLDNHGDEWIAVTKEIKRLRELQHALGL